MTRIRYTLLALSAIALVSAFVTGQATADPDRDGRRWDFTKNSEPPRADSFNSMRRKVEEGFNPKRKTAEGLTKNKQQGKNPVGFRDEVFRTNDRVMTMR